MIWGNILGLKNEGLGLFQYKEDFTLEKHRLLLQDTRGFTSGQTLFGGQRVLTQSLTLTLTSALTTILALILTVGLCL